MSQEWTCIKCGQVQNKDGRCANIANNLCPNCFFTREREAREHERREYRYSNSLGKERTLYCKFCIEEREVYSAAGHQVGEMNLHCCECASFVTRLVHKNGKWEIDRSVYT